MKTRSRRSRNWGLALLGPLLAAPPAFADGADMLRKEVVVAAPLDAVWEAWTTPQGLKFATRESRVELRPGGRYEWFLDGPADERGVRGSEGSRVLAFVPRQMLAFDWTFPPAVPSLRSSGAKTQVVVFFDELGGGRVRVRFVQHGWEEGSDWEAGRAYFDRAWSWVLDQLKSELEASRGADTGS